MTIGKSWPRGNFSDEVLIFIPEEKQSQVKDAVFAQAQLARLDSRLGQGVGAKKERAKLQRIIEKATNG